MDPFEPCSNTGAPFKIVLFSTGLFVTPREWIDKSEKYALFPENLPYSKVNLMIIKRTEADPKWRKCPIEGFYGSSRKMTIMNKYFFVYRMHIIH